MVEFEDGIKKLLIFIKKTKDDIGNTKGGSTGLFT